MHPSPNNPLVKAVISIVLVAVGIRLTIDLLRPVLPWLLGIAVAWAVVYLVVLVRRSRDRW